MATERWTTVRLGDAATVLSGGTPSKQRSEYWGGTFPWVSAKDLKTSVICTSQLQLTSEGKKVAKRAPEGSVLILVRGMTLLKDVPVGFVGRDVAFNQDIKALVPRPGVSGRFLGYVLTAFKHRLLGLVNVAGHGTGRLDTELLKDFTFDLPGPGEQRRIVEVLGAWDEAIDSFQRLISAKQDQQRGLMQALLTGKKRFTEYANLAWRSAPLADYVASARKGKPASLNDAGRGVPYIGSAAFDGDYTSHTDDPSAVRCSAKDVLLLWDGEYAGKSTTGHVGAVGSTVVAITLKPGLDPRYLHNLLLFHNQRIRSVREGSGIPHMPSDFFTWFKPHLPPIEEQRTIASVLSTADEEMRMLEAQLEAYELQKRGLMQQLFTGEKRVNVDISEAVPA